MCSRKIRRNPSSRLIRNRDMFLKHFTVPLLLAASILGAPAELDTRQSCSDLQLVHLAGTTERGLGMVGTPLSKALASAVPGTTTYSVPYNTNAEYIETVTEGAAMTADYLKSQASSCPNQRFVLSGYSKGALVIHRVETNQYLPADVKAKVLSILVFGDPARNANRPWPINSPSVNSAPREGRTTAQNIASFCNKGDQFCDAPGYSMPAHLAYPNDGSIGVAANFVKAQV